MPTSLPKTALGVLYACGNDWQLLEAPFTHCATWGRRAKSGLGNTSMRRPPMGLGSLSASCHRSCTACVQSYSLPPPHFQFACDAAVAAILEWSGPFPRWLRCCSCLRFLLSQTQTLLQNYVAVQAAKRLNFVAAS